MNVQDFIEKFAEAIEVDSADLTAETEFRNLDEWDSVAYLSVIAMIDEEYERKEQEERDYYKQMEEDYYKNLEDG